MTKRYLLLACVALLAALYLPLASAQMPSAVKGIAKDTDGKPIVGATIEMLRPETGRQYKLTTDKKGEFMSIAIDGPGKYNIKLIKDGKVLYLFNNFMVQASTNANDNLIEFDLQKLMKEQAATLTEEQKQQAKQAEESQKEAAKIKDLNKLLAEANADIQAKNYDHAMSIMQQAVQQDTTHDVVFGTMAEAQRLAAASAADQATRQKLYQDSIAGYKKAIELKRANPKGSTANVASYYNNLGEAYAKINDTQAAIQAYDQAAQLDPTGAGQYYFNEGAVLTNTGKVDDAVKAFDKSIQADPTKADAYYWKGVNMLGKATVAKDGKMEAPAGTSEAFNKYLELQPTGPLGKPPSRCSIPWGPRSRPASAKRKRPKRSNRQ